MFFVSYSNYNNLLHACMFQDGALNLQCAKFVAALLNNILREAPEVLEHASLYTIIIYLINNRAISRLEPTILCELFCSSLWLVKVPIEHRCRFNI